MQIHTVLLVEGDPDLREAITSLLADYTVTPAVDGAEALDLLGDCYDTGPPLPDVVVSARALPILSGEFLQATIRGLPDPIPVVLLGDVTLDPDVLRGMIDRAVARAEVVGIVHDLVRTLSEKSRVRVERRGRAVRVSVID